MSRTISLFDSRKPLYNFLRACTTGNVRYVENTCRHWSELKLSDVNWFDGLSVACKFGHHRAVESLLKIYSNFTQTTKHRFLREHIHPITRYAVQIIRYAVQHNLQHLLKTLGIDPNSTFESYAELVIGTAIRGDCATLQRLLSNLPFDHQEAEDVEFLYCDAFDYSCFGGHQGSISWLSQVCRERNLRLNYDSALFYGGASGKKWVIEWLLRQRPHGNKAKIFEGAIRCGNLSLAKEYAEHVPRVENWSHALLSAATYGHVAIVRWILDLHANGFLKSGLSAAATAAATSHEWEIVRLLLERGANNFRDILNLWISDDEDLLSFHLKDHYPPALAAKRAQQHACRGYPANAELCARLQDEMNVVAECVKSGARFGRCRLGTNAKEKKIWEFLVWSASRCGTEAGRVATSALAQPDVITKRVLGKYTKWRDTVQKVAEKYFRAADLEQLVMVYC